jgi:hypothetical protein
MSCCHAPGEVLVLPTDHSVKEHSPYELKWSVAAILDRNEVEQPKHMALPFVARVPEGEEQRAAARFMRIPHVLAAAPNYYVRAEAAPFQTFDEPIERAISLLGWPRCLSGKNVLVAILDTAIAGSSVANLTPELNAIEPGRPPSKTSGHGTLVARIISRMAPDAILVPVRVLGESSTLATLVAGLLMAEAKYQPDIYNLSLSTFIGQSVCPRCNPVDPIVERARIELIFNCFRQVAPDVRGAHRRRSSEPSIVAAAGSAGEVPAPARFDGVLAVGGESKASEQVPHRRIARIPVDRFLLAPDGPFGTEDDSRSINPLGGSSFATAFVSAATACCFELWSRHWHFEQCRSSFLLGVLQENCARDFPGGYRADRHGLGLLRWKNRLPSPIARIESLERVKDDRWLRELTHQRVAETAYQNWAGAGRPDGRANEFWSGAEHQLGLSFNADG